MNLLRTTIKHEIVSSAQVLAFAGNAPIITLQSRELTILVVHSSLALCCEVNRVQEMESRVENIN